MVVVKNLALGVLLTGIIAAPSLGGAMSRGLRPSSPANGELHAPTTLTYAAPSRPVVSATENLATVGGGNGSFGIGGSGYGPAFGYGTGRYAPPSNGNALATTSSVWGTTSNSLATTDYPSAPTPPAYTPPAVTYSAPSPSYGNAPSPGLSLAGSPGGGGSAGHSVDAYLNFGTSAYSEASSLTSGGPQAWYLSPTVRQVYNGVPNVSQQASFIAEVMQTVQHTYALSGMNVSLTADPTQNYAHTMNVVAGASYTANPDAIGITDVGNDGYSFIDKFSQAKNPDELATAVGHNIAHELMHAFGIASHPDDTGTHIDAATATWAVLTNPDSTFSGQATQMLGTENFLKGPGKDFTQGALGLTGSELLAAHQTFTGEEAVPEPTTVALWGLAGGIALACHRRRKLA